MSYSLAMEEISAACASCGVIMSVNNSLFCDPIYKIGTDAQKKDTLTPCARGEKLGCFGLTEPMSGSDAQTMATNAEKVAGGWVINGAKNWITNGFPHADFILLFAVTDRSGPKIKHTALLVPKGTPGFTQNARDHKLGIHAAHSCTVFFENCKVPESAVVGNVGEGFKVAMAHARRRAASGSPARRSASPRRRSPRRRPTPRSVRASASPSASTRPSSSCWPTWPPSSTPPACSRGAPPP